MLSRGTFRNLYVYGYDFPEGYAIEKDGAMYYAFFAPAPAAGDAKGARATWTGEIELRGLAAGNTTWWITLMARIWRRHRAGRKTERKLCRPPAHKGDEGVEPRSGLMGNYA